MTGPSAPGLLATPSYRPVRGRLVVALGGNALIRRGEAGSTEVQRRNLDAAVRSLHELVGAGHEVVITHGNGPQVGFLALEAEAAAELVPPPPLDVLGAESQGQIGYLLDQALLAELRRGGDEREVVTILTQTAVAANDRAFGRPTKPVGPVYDEVTARALASSRGWSVAPDGDGWRRVVPSPEPIRIIEAETIARLVDSGALVIASGGGGVPVVEQADGSVTGVEAVIDKDLAAVVLALAVGAESLLLLTDVDGAYRGWGTRTPVPLRALGSTAARALLAAGAFAAGSMGPKVEACVRFVEAGGRLAAIGALEQASATIAGRAGTRITPGHPAAARAATDADEGASDADEGSADADEGLVDGIRKGADREGIPGRR